MINELTFRFRLRKLLRNEKKVKEDYDRYIEEAKDDINEKKAVISEAMAFVGEEERKIRELYTDHLMKLAKVFIIPLPKLDDESKWERNGYSRMILTKEGIHEFKKTIRLEQKERREIIFGWITLLIGLIGTLIGLFSLILK